MTIAKNTALIIKFASEIAACYEKHDSNTTSASSADSTCRHSRTSALLLRDVTGRVLKIAQQVLPDRPIGLVTSRNLFL